MTREKVFADVIRRHGDIQTEVFQPINQHLEPYREGILLLVGMQEDLVDLIFTAEGNIRNFVFVEQLVSAAPQVQGWMFQALKPAMPVDKFGIEMNGYKISGSNLFFYAEDHDDLPDLIDIKVVYMDMRPDAKDAAVPGVFVFLENLLGELRFATDVDDVEVIGPDEASQALIPIAKLSDYLVWRQKEFVEKYEGRRHDLDNDSYSIMEASMPDGSRIMAVVNTDLLNWDAKASHPWMLLVTVHYDGSQYNGMPSEEVLDKLNEIHDAFEQALSPEEGCLILVRQTGNHERLVYIACEDFRKPSLVASEITGQRKWGLQMDYKIFSDKYWLSVERFRA